MTQSDLLRELMSAVGRGDKVITLPQEDVDALFELLDAHKAKKAKAAAPKE